MARQQMTLSAARLTAERRAVLHGETFYVRRVCGSSDSCYIVSRDGSPDSSRGRGVVVETVGPPGHADRRQSQGQSQSRGEGRAGAED